MASCIQVQTTTMKLLLLLLMFLMLHLTPAGTSTCHTSSVMRGKPAKISCDFTVDVSKTKTDFNVQKYDDDGRPAKEILSCLWLTSDQPECNNIAHGYIYNGPATNSLTVVIPSATEEHVGRYACQVVTVDHTAADIVPCNFTLEEIAQETESVKNTQGSNQQLVSEKDGEESVGLIAVPVVGVLALAIAAGLVWWKRRFISEKLRLRRDRNEGSSHTSTNGEQERKGDACEELVEQNENKEHETTESSVLLETPRNQEVPGKSDREDRVDENKAATPLGPTEFNSDDYLTFCFPQEDGGDDHHASFYEFSIHMI